MSIDKELAKSSSKLLVLSVLKEQELYGYQIIKLIKMKSDDVLSMGEGTLYPILHELERSRCLTSRWVKQKDAPDRKYYAITAKGRKLLKEESASWNAFADSIAKVTTQSNPMISL